MLPRLKNKVYKFYKRNTKTVKIVLIAVLCFIVLLLLYKMLFYSNAESAVYGTRLTGIKENKISNDEINDLEDNFSKKDKIDNVNIKIKGRLIKYFIYINEDVDKEYLKSKINDSVKDLKNKIKTYYDIEYYVVNQKNENESYPIIGYKHKNKDIVSYDEF